MKDFDLAKPTPEKIMEAIDELNGYINDLCDAYCDCEKGIIAMNMKLDMILARMK